MKKNLLALLLVIAAFATTASAQLQKGYYLIGGDLATANIGFSDGTPFNINISPKVAWFRSNNLAVGGFINLGLSTAKDLGTTVNYGIGPLARYYFGSSTVSTTGTTSARSSGRWFVEGDFGIQGINTSGGSSTTGLGIGIGPGLAYFVNENIALEALLKYNKVFGFGNDGGQSLLGINLGFQIYLPRGSMRAQVDKIKN
ncbi:MAG TPA: outer membrane beta-barrel protein [Chitinophagaceae bacterium]|nr:outer membrane beta-barrel protein [Chitinophagaceae bacterium]